MLNALRISLVCIFSCVATLAQSQSSYYKFTENKGQFPENVLFSAELENGILFFEKDRFTYSLRNTEDLARIGSYHGNIVAEKNLNVRCHAYEVVFHDSWTEEINGSDIQKGITSYFKGNDPNKWASGCRSFGEIRYKNIYEGIDLRVYANDFLLKFEYIVAPDADPSIIQQVYNHTDQLKLKDGRVEVTTNAGIMTEQRPVSYQKENGNNVLIKSAYKKNRNSIIYTFPEGYDSSKELVIDPELIFSTYSGSISNNFGYTASFDNEGFLYSGSSAFGNNYPITLGSFQENWAEGVVDIAVSKVDTTGTFLVWSAFLGGDDNELPHSIVVNDNNELFVLGSSGSDDFPVTIGAYDFEFSGGDTLLLSGSDGSQSGLGFDYNNGVDIVLSKISSDGTELLGSTFVGGTENDGVNYGSALKYNYADEIRGEIQLDDFGEVFVVSSTHSTDFPVSDDAAQLMNNGNQDAIVFKMNAALTAMEWGTYVGGSEHDAGYSLAFDQSGAVLLCGGTRSDNFPIEGNALQEDYAGGAADGFFTKVINEGQQIVYSTYYGSTAYDQLYFTETDTEDNLYVFGQTEHDASQFITNAAYNTPGGGQIISKFTSNLEGLVWSTAFGTGGGQPNISPTAFLVDVCNRIYLSGWGGTTGGGALGVTGMDVTLDAYKGNSTTGDFYLMVLFDDASDLFYGSFFGGDTSNEHVDGGTSRFNRKGQIYQAVCAGCGGNDDFPIKPPNTALSATNNGTTENGSNGCNLGVFKFDFNLPLTIADFIVPNQLCANQPFTIDNQSTFSNTFEWDFGDGSPVVVGVSNPTHMYDEPGTYEIKLTVTSAETCNAFDELSKTVTVGMNSVTTSNELILCLGDSEVIGPDMININYDYLWSPVDFLSETDTGNPTSTPEEDIEYILSIRRGACMDTLFQSIDIEEVVFSIPEDTLLCEGVVVDIELTTPDDLDVIWSDIADFSTQLNDSQSDYDISVNVLETTTFYVSASNALCEEINEVTVNVFSDFVELGSDISICSGDAVVIAVQNAWPGADYSWTPENVILSGNGTSEVTIETSLAVTMTVVATFGDCEAEDEITVNVIDASEFEFDATADPTTIIEGGESQLNTTINGWNYSWFPPGSLSDSQIQNPVATPGETTTYTVIASQGNCSQSSQVTVNVVDYVCGDPLVFVPNAFSPNGDSENDQLLVYGQNLTEVHLAIFNRWGQKVFETFDQSIGWNGEYNGKLSDPAVFDYYLEVTCTGGEDYFEKGNITLVR